MIALNFLPTATRQFSFRIFRSEAPLGSQEMKPDTCRVFRLPLQDVHGEWHPWAVSLETHSGLNQFIVQSGWSKHLTCRAIAHGIRKRGVTVLGSKLSADTEDMFPNKVYVDVEMTHHGVRQVSLRPYYLARTDTFGIICGFRFKPIDPDDRSAESQKGSFSLDSFGKANRKKLIDTAEFLGRFLREFRSLFEAVDLGGEAPLEFASQFQLQEAVSLPSPQFEAGQGKSGGSAFALVMKYGPARTVERTPAFCFCFGEQDRELSRRVYRGLRGEISGNFKGFEKTYGIDLNAENTLSSIVADWTDDSLDLLAKDIKSKCGDQLPFAVVTLPKESDDDESIYWRVKSRLLRADIHSQLVRRNTIVNTRTFEYSLPNLSLNIFAKCGGIPWLAKTSSQSALVVGVSQSIKKNGNGEIERVFGYAVVTDTSGSFHGMRFLADSAHNTDYGTILKENLIRLLSGSRANYNRCAIHASFELRQSDVAAVQGAALAVSSPDFEIVAVQLSDTKNWIGFNKSDPLLVPSDGTLVQLSNRESLAWLVATARGLDGGRPNRPVLATRLFPAVTHADIVTQCLREASGLSGLSWRNFGQSSLPVSILYARNIARALAACPELHEILQAKEYDWPWFI